ncbi:hypothetical protein GCM10027360_31290 [Amycolatopsis echigonensis]|uniref:Uncharacterized protein n=1 Tax=Amycolatopsis tucumanensis TaxID=401106 RepID=A0ABP7IKG5_9PSEU
MDAALPAGNRRSVDPHLLCERLLCVSQGFATFREALSPHSHTVSVRTDSPRIVPLPFAQVKPGLT